MEVSTEIVRSLRILGLPSDATADDVRSAFRRLARTYHPDVAGRLYSRKFEQIANAYAFLKDVPLPETSHAGAEAASHAPRSRETARPVRSGIGYGFSFRDVLGKPVAWYRKRLERAEAEKDRLRRAAEDARKQASLAREARIENILSRGERLTDDLEGRMERETRDVGIQGLAVRLMSGVCQVRHMALSHLGELANQSEAFNLLTESLIKWDMDDKTARLVTALPLTPENHRRLARALLARAAVMPNALLAHLLQLYNPRAADRELWESYLHRAGASGIVLILRWWPRGNFVSGPTLRRLISHSDESVLTAVLSAMKQRSIQCPYECLERLSSHLSHPNMAVRVWAKALMPAAAKQH